MQTLTPSAQQGTQGPQAAGAASAVAPEPLFSGPAPALWAGVGAFILIFILVLMLIIRGRVVRPSQRKVKHQPPNYFEPAGEDADITFEDEAPAADAQDHQERWADEPGEEPETGAEPHEPDGRHRGDLMEAPHEEAVEAPEEDEAPRKKKSAFAGLFSKNPANEDHSSETAAPEEAEETAPAEEPRIESFFDEPAAPDYPSERARPAPEPAVDATRLARAEDTAQQALKRAENAEKLASDLARANANTERTIALGLQENETALTAMSERLTTLAKEFQTRLETTPAPAAHAHDAHDGLSEAHFAEFADLIGEQFESLRGAVNEAIDRLSRRIDHLPAAAPHAVAPTAARVQLADLLSDALPPQRYDLGRRMTSGRTADACIQMPGRLAPIAVDARFPVEIFDTWQRARRETRAPQEEETALRRVILRHIADAGEKLIIDGETADCAMMFIPSEHILSELHAHFPDLVQESYRARVWMTSPTSLMATLHTISAVMAGSGIAAGTQTNGADDVAKELAALRERILALETSRGNGSQERRETPSMHYEYAAGEESSPEPAHAPQEAHDTAPEDKPPFPLR